MATMRPVTVNRTVDGLSVIGEGLRSGEVVVTDGHLSLRDGSAVSVKNTVPAAAGG